MSKLDPLTAAALFVLGGLLFFGLLSAGENHWWPIGCKAPTIATEAKETT